jgi:hypothetical protein
MLTKRDKESTKKPESANLTLYSWLFCPRNDVTLSMDNKIFFCFGVRSTLSYAYPSQMLCPAQKMLQDIAHETCSLKRAMFVPELHKWTCCLFLIRALVYDKRFC